MGKTKRKPASTASATEKKPEPASVDDGEDSLRSPLGLPVLLLTLVVALLAMWFAERRYESIHQLTKLSPEEQEMTFTTESAFYYSFYKDVVDAPSIQSAYHQLSHNSATEHPDTIDVLHRFNVLQEVLLGLMYRSWGWGSPMQFYLRGCFVLFGIGMGSMFLLGCLLSGGIGGGVLVVTLLQCNWFEACRVWNAPVLRENFGVPFFMLQMCCWVVQLSRHPPMWPKTSAIGTVLSTTAVLLSWQFGHYLLFTQMIAFSLMHMAGQLTPDKLLQFSILHGVSILQAAVLLKGNSLFLESPHLLLTLHAVATACVEWLFPSSETCASTFSRTAARVSKSLLLLLALSLARMVLLGSATESAHIFSVLQYTLGMSSKQLEELDFHSLLYATQTEFQPLSYEWISKLWAHGLLPCAALGSLFVVVQVLVDLWNDTVSHPAAVFVFAQASACMIMAGAMMRFVVLGVPMAAVLSSAICIRWRMIRGTRLGAPAAVVACTVLVLSCVLSCGWENASKGWEVDDGSPTDLSVQTARMNDWIGQHTAPDAAFFSDFVTLSAIKLGSKRPIVIHPQYESLSLRERAAQVYRIYGHNSPAAIHKIATRMKTEFLVMDRRHCEWKTGSSLSFTKLVDTMGTDSSQLLCQALHTSPVAAKMFQLEMYNPEFSVYRIVPSAELEKKGEKQTQQQHFVRATLKQVKTNNKAGAGLCHYATWLKDNFGASQMYQPVFDAALKAPSASHDASCLNNHAIHLDEDLNLVEPAEKWYKAAVEASSSSTASILGDYAYFKYLIQSDASGSIALYRKALKTGEADNAQVLCSFSVVRLNTAPENGEGRSDAHREARALYNRAERADRSNQCVKDFKKTFG